MYFLKMLSMTSDRQYCFIYDGGGKSLLKINYSSPETDAREIIYILVFMTGMLRLGLQLANAVCFE